MEFDWRAGQEGSCFARTEDCFFGDPRERMARKAAALGLHLGGQFSDHKRSVFESELEQPAREEEDVVSAPVDKEFRRVPTDPLVVAVDYDQMVRFVAVFVQLVWLEVSPH